MRAPLYQQDCPSGLKVLLVKPFASTAVSVKPGAFLVTMATVPLFWLGVTAKTMIKPVN
ncbi:MAG: hypothetical protein QW318_06850 [Candidatus Caldarchaeum sp.]